MSSFSFKDDTDEDATPPDVGVLTAGGELDYAASPELRERIARHIEAGRRRLVLDLSSVSFIDSTAIGVIVGAVRKLDEAGGGSLAIVCTDENVLQILKITGLDSMITLHRSRDEAFSAPVVAG